MPIGSKETSTMIPGARPERSRLKVDMDGLDDAFNNSSIELAYYLDQQTGEVVMVTDEIRRTLDEIYEELPEEEDWADGAFEAAVSKRDLPAWEEEALSIAHMVEAGLGDRYIEIPRAESRDGYNDMEEFIATVDDRGLLNRLEDAIRGKGAFRRFKNVLLGHPGEQARWFQFRDSRVHDRILEWLEEEGIEPELK